MDDRFGEMLDMLPEERTRYYAMIRRLTPGQRADKVVGLSRAARDLAEYGVAAALEELGLDYTLGKS